MYACAALACSDPELQTGNLGNVPDAGQDGGSEPDDGIGMIGGRVQLTVTGVEPNSGPFAGGNMAIVRGSRFSDEALVLVGGRMVQPSDTLRIDANSLSIVLPAGDVGSADVTVLDGDDEATREDAYTYNPLLIEPTQGSVAGGTSVLITVHGASFGPSASIEIGDMPCSDVRVITPSTLRCKTPEGEVGLADVVVVSEDGDVPALVAVDAFEYIDFTDTQEGGLSGGPIRGDVNVTVIDGFTGRVIPNAFVLLGDDLDSPFQKLTNENGQVTFSDEDLTGPVSIHVAVNCFERVSIVAFDASNVTIELSPLLDPTCGDPGDLEPGSGRAMAGAEIEGELLFPGSDEFSVNPWDEVVPEPRANERRVAYVFTTQSRVESPNPPPDLSMGIARIEEATSTIGLRGFPYRIFARPAGLAIYAVAGLERNDTGELTPYVMGVTRDLITAPAELLSNVDISMTIPLDRKLDVELGKLPERTPTGPMELRVQAHLDLGGEGVIVRRVGGKLLDLRKTFTGGEAMSFFAQPPLSGGLSDARYELLMGYYTTDEDDVPPFTQLRRRGVLPESAPELVDDLLEIPVATEPLEGGQLPADRVLRWQMPGTQPDLWVVSVLSASSPLVWTQIVRGSQSETTLPDFADIPEVGDVPDGLLLWSVQAVRAPDFVYDELKLGQLADRFYSHLAVNRFTMQR